MPLNTSERSPVSGEPKRRTSSPGRQFRRRPSVERTPQTSTDSYPIQTTPSTLSPQKQSGRSSLFLNLSTEFRAGLDLYFWMFVRIAMFLLTSLVISVHIAVPLLFGFAILYFDVYHRLSSSRRGSKRSVAIAIFVLLTVLFIKFRELPPTASETSSFPEPKAAAPIPVERPVSGEEELERRIRQHSQELVSQKVGLLEEKLVSLEHSGTPNRQNQLTPEIAIDLIRRELQQTSQRLTPEQFNQVQTLITTHLEQFQVHQRQPEHMEIVVRRVIGEVTGEFKREIDDLRQTLSRLSSSSLKEVVQKWVEDEVRRSTVQASGETAQQQRQPTAEELNQQAQNLNFSPDQASFVSGVIAESLQKYSALYSRLITPSQTITTLTGELTHRPSDLFGSQHFGIWKVPIGSKVELSLLLKQKIHPFLFLLTSSYTQLHQQQEPIFLCPPASFQLFSGGQLIGEGSFNTTEPRLTQDYQLTPPFPSLSSPSPGAFSNQFRLVIEPSDSARCQKDNQALVQFKQLIFGFPETQ